MSQKSKPFNTKARLTKEAAKYFLACEKIAHEHGGIDWNEYAHQVMCDIAYGEE